MTPIFLERSFLFEEDEQVPDHIEGWPYRHIDEQDPKKWWLRGTDTFSYEDYVLAINIDDIETALFLARAARRAIVRDQPNAGGIQDRVDVMHPSNPIYLRG